MSGPWSRDISFVDTIIQERGRENSMGNTNSHIGILHCPSCSICHHVALLRLWMDHQLRLTDKHLDFCLTIDLAEFSGKGRPIQIGLLSILVMQTNTIIHDRQGLQF